VRPPARFCLLCRDTPWRDSILNVLLFVPLGLALARALPGIGARRAVLGTAALSLVIELLQMLMPGRVPGLRDVLANTLGGAAGFLVGRHLRTLLRPAPAAARRLAAGGAMALALVIGGTAWLLAPDLPDDLYYGQWAPRFAWRPVFRGTLLDAHLGREPLPRGPESWAGDLRGRLRDGAALEVRLIPGAPRPGYAPVASVVDEHRREIASLVLRRDELVFRSRSVASRFGLRTTAVALLDAVGRDTAGVHVVTAERRGARLMLRARGPDGAERRAERALSVGLGWYLALPGPMGFGPAAPALAAAWLALLVLPVAWWTARTRRRPALPALAALLALLLGVVPPLAGAAASPWWEWAGVVGALLAAAAAARQRPKASAEA
jgi:hypothetical protein